MEGLDVGFERMCKFGAGSMCTGNGKLRPAWSFWALLNDTSCGSRLKCMLSLKLCRPIPCMQNGLGLLSICLRSPMDHFRRNLADDAFRSLQEYKGSDRFQDGVELLLSRDSIEQDLAGHPSSKQKHSRAPETLAQPAAQSSCNQDTACKVAGPNVYASLKWNIQLLMPIL